METLAEIYKRHSGPGKFNDKGSVHDYISGVYEELFAPYRTTANRFMELGLFDGWSMRMWEAYWGPQCAVYGIDCDEQPHGGMADLRPMIAECTHRISIMDATDGQAFDACFGLSPMMEKTIFDIIVEDCSHDLDQQLKLWEVWSQRLASGGLYVIEDLQTEMAIDKFSGMGFEILDRRSNGRYDNILAVYHKGVD